MTDDMTPLEALDEAVRAFVQATAEDGSGELSAWVLGVQTSTFTAEEGLLPLVFSSDYTMGPATSPETAIGLLRLAEARVTRIMLEDDDD